MRYIISKIILLSLFVIISMNSYSQTSYRLASAENSSSSTVKISLTIYCKDKKSVDNEARSAAVRIALFDGCPQTRFTKPLLDEGEATSYQKHSEYFDNLYGYRLNDFISSCVATSKFKKADKEKGTSYIVEVKVLQLRKDLEKNHIKNRMGL